MNRSMPGLPVQHQLPEFTQIDVHRVSDAIQPCHPLLSPSPPVPNPSQHQSLFHWVNSSHEEGYWWLMLGEFLPLSLLCMWLFLIEMVHLWYLWESSKCLCHTNPCCAFRCQSNDSIYCVGHNVYSSFSVTSAPHKGQPPFPSVTLPKPQHLNASTSSLWGWEMGWWVGHLWNITELWQFVSLPSLSFPQHAWMYIMSSLFALESKETLASTIILFFQAG